MVLIVLCLVLVTNDVRQHHFHKQKIYLLRIFSIYPASISVKKGLFSSKQHRSTRRNNSLHPGYLTSLVTRTNHNTIQTISIYVRVFRTADHAGQIFIPHRPLCKFCLNCSRGLLFGVVSWGLFMSGRFCPGWILSVLVLSEYICYIRKLNITLNFMFRMYDKKCISVTSHALYPSPLSQTVTPSRTPPPLERDVLYGRPLCGRCRNIEFTITIRIYIIHYITFNVLKIIRILHYITCTFCIMRLP